MAAGALLLGACRPDAAPDDDAPVAALAPAATGIRYLAAGEGEDDGFAYALAPRRFEFPADHGSHDEYRTEWWYFTGNVQGRGGRHYGFELTFFRYALTPTPPESPSSWTTNQFWMAHLAVTDTANARLLAEERMTRGALGLAGAESDAFHVWVENWSVEATAGGAPERLALDARGDRVALELALEPAKPPVLHGDGGLDPKGPERGNASFYYSWPRIDVEGTIEVDGEAEDVAGLAWMDREWSTSALSPDVEGWDWFALQLDDGRELMYYRLRRADGGTSPYSGGSLIERDGRRTALGAEDVRLAALGFWESARTSTRYPAGWRLTVPAAGLDVDIEPYVADQEIDLSVRYWEGAVRVEGRAGERRIGGRGYVELAGY